MSLHVSLHTSTKPSEIVAGSDSKRPKRQVAGGRRVRHQRDNIENAQSSNPPLLTSLANLPIQKQSTKNRKRLLSENQTTSSLCPSDPLSAKRHKYLQEESSRSNSPVLSALASSLSVPPLHRTLSDKSSYLNQTSSSHDPASLHLKDSSRTQLTLTSWRRDHAPKRSGSESDDADDEDDASNPFLTSTPSCLPALTEAKAQPVILNGPRLGLIDVAFGAQSSPTKSLPISVCDDELFGSDTTLTSPEDDSEDELDLASSSLAVPVVQPVAAPSTPPTTPVKRRGPGRPRKEHSSEPKVLLPQRKRVGVPTEDIVAWSNNVPTEVASSTSDGTPKQTRPTSRFILNKTAFDFSQRYASIPKEIPVSNFDKSLMARVIERRLSSQTEDDFSDESAAEAGSVNRAPTPVAQTLDKGAAIDPSSSSNKPPTTETSRNVDEHESPPSSAEAQEKVSLIDPPPSIVSLAPIKHDDHVFATPLIPVRRCESARASQYARLRTISRHNPFKLPVPLDFIMPSRRTISKQTPVRSPFVSKTRSSNMPRPRLFRTCLEIMSESNPDGRLSNIHSIKMMLKQSLEQGLRKVQASENVVMTTSSPQKMSQTASVSGISVPLNAWGAVIGNGKGLFKGSTRKQDQQVRMAERRILVANAYRALELPLPPEGWDKSSKVIADFMTLKSGPISGTVEGSVGRQWPDGAALSLDQHSSRLGCDYCQKTYKNRSGLAYHMERCPMLRLQTSISSDVDDDSTASETEDQRKARCPSALRSRSVGERTSDHGSAHEEVDDEEGIIMCVCGSKEDEGAMVQCDKCKVWLHLECVNLSEDEVPEEYFCPPCQGVPTAKTGGKSFRPVPSKASRRKSLDSKAASRVKMRGRSERRGSSMESDWENMDDADNRFRPSEQAGVELRLESDSEIEEAYSVISDEEDESVREGMVSPQVVLNHDWEVDGHPSSDLGYDSEYVTSHFGVSSTRAFKKSRAPALMLDGSSSQEGPQASIGTLLSSDLGYDPNDDILFPTPDPNLPTDGLGLGSDGPASFSLPQSFQYLQSTEPLFAPHYLGDDADQILISEDSMDSEGLRTPVDLCHGEDHVDFWGRHDVGDLADESSSVFHLERNRSMRANLKSGQYATGMDQLSGLLASNVEDWYCDLDSSRDDDFDLDGLIDLNAATITDE